MPIFQENAAAEINIDRGRLTKRQNEKRPSLAQTAALNAFVVPVLANDSNPQPSPRGGDDQSTIAARAAHDDDSVADRRGGRGHGGVFWRTAPVAKRLRRPPPDPINVLLSFGYTLLAHAAEGAVAATGLDVYAGFLHSIDYNRPSLALDLIEEFRPLVDGVVLWCCNGGQITPADFTPGTDPDRPVVMSDQARKRFIAAYERRLEETFIHPVANQKLTIRQCLLALARLLEQLAKLIDAEADGIRIYRLCGDCASVVRIVGQSKVVKTPEFVFLAAATPAGVRFVRVELP